MTRPYSLKHVAFFYYQQTRYSKWCEVWCLFNQNPHQILLGFDRESWDEDNELDAIWVLFGSWRLVYRQHSLSRLICFIFWMKRKSIWSQTTDVIPVENEERLDADEHISLLTYFLVCIRSHGKMRFVLSATSLQSNLLQKSLPTFNRLHKPPP